MHQLILVFSVLATRVLPRNKYTTFFVFSSSLAKMYSIDRLAIQKMKFGFRSSNIRIKFTLNNWCLTPSRVQNNWQFLYDYSFYPSFFPSLSNSSFQFRLVQFIATFGDYPTVLCFEDDIIIILSLVSLRHIHPATILAPVSEL